VSGLSTNGLKKPHKRGDGLFAPLDTFLGVGESEL